MARDLDRNGLVGNAAVERQRKAFNGFFPEQGTQLIVHESNRRKPGNCCAPNCFLRPSGHREICNRRQMMWFRYSWHRRGGEGVGLRGNYPHLLPIDRVKVRTKAGARVKARTRTKARTRVRARAVVQK